MQKLTRYALNTLAFGALVAILTAVALGFCGFFDNDRNAHEVELLTNARTGRAL